MLLKLSSVSLNQDVQQPICDGLSLSRRVVNEKMMKKRSDCIHSEVEI